MNNNMYVQEVRMVNKNFDAYSSIYQNTTYNPFSPCQAKSKFTLLTSN